MNELIYYLEKSLDKLHRMHTESKIDKVKFEILEYISRTYRQHDSEYLIEIYRIFGEIFDDEDTSKKVIYIENNSLLIDHKCERDHSDSSAKYKVETVIDGNSDYKQQKSIKEIVLHLNEMRKFYQENEEPDNQILRARNTESKLNDKIVIKSNSNGLYLSLHRLIED